MLQRTLGFGLLFLLLFTIVFKCFQTKEIYEKTLAKVTPNYQKFGGWGSTDIRQVYQPYQKINNENLNHWDADIYRCIKEKMYLPTGECYSKVRPAFFPLFPLVWKALGLNSIGISIFNFLLFCFSVSLLLKVFLKKEQNLWVYISLFIASPFMVFFIIPYSESVFFFSVTLLFYGVMKNKYPYYFAGGILISMARSASFFIAIPILILEIIFLFSRTKISLAIKESALKILPFVIGFLVVLCIQYYYSNSWNAFLEAQAHWPKSTIITLNFVDWSFEGFGLACFAIFFAAIPAFLLFFNLIFSDKSPLNFPLNSKEEFTISPEKYITLISVFYLILIFIYTLLARGGSLNSFPRYSLATPFFYVIILYVSQNFSLKKQALYSLILLVLLVAFLAWVSYGGDKISFYYLGMYLSLFSMVLLLLLPQIKILALRISLIAVFVFLSIIWNSYLLNIFLSDGWIFT